MVSRDQASDGDSPEKKSRRVWWIVVVAVVGIFVLDCVLPPGYAVWILYLIPVLISAQMRRARWPLVVAGICTGLIVAGLFLSSPGMPVAFAVFNRTLGVTALWIAALLLRQRQQTEAALRSQEGRFRHLFESNVLPIAYWNMEGRFTDANLAWCRLTGVDHSQVRDGKVSWITITPPEMQARDRVAIGEIQAKGVCEPYEKDFFRPDGSRVNVLISGSLLPGSGAEGIAFAVDLTERRRAEAEIAMTKAQLETLLTQAPVGFAYFDRDLRYLLINDRLAQMNGLSVEAHLGKTIAEIVPSLLPTVQQVVARILATGEPMVGHEFSGETPLQPGVTRYWSESWYPVRDAAGQVTGFGVVVEEITARKRAERELKQAMEATEQSNRQLQDANRELEAFAYTVAHDLRAPLRHIQGFTRVLLENYRSTMPPQAQKHFDLVARGAKMMGQLVDDLLAYARLGRQEIHRQTIAMQQLVNSLWESLSHEYAGRRVEFDVAPLPDGQADPSLLGLVWQNLLLNALKFTRGRDPARIEVGARSEPGENLYFVRDNGVGFDMRYVQKLFGLFQRLHREEDYEGTGVGLATVARIIHRHGGRVWAESELDRGATFFFTLPRKDTP
jgi:PAS domain S-box-containing protein